jgi:Bifunctional DNA primase/polymerase, N-terminal/AAA domain
MTTREEYALSLAAQGFSIFPLRPATKIPFGGIKWKAIASSDPEVIKRWFYLHDDMNYAVVCDDEHVILDLDDGGPDHHTGVKNFHYAEDEECGWPTESIFDQTFRVRTPKGGVHLYFRCHKPYRNSVSKIIPSVDVRARDGYVLGPGCYTFADPPSTEEGEYRVENSADMAEIPTWIEQRLDFEGLSEEKAANAGSDAMPIDMEANVVAAKEVLARRAPAIEGQGGDNWTFETAAYLKDYGISEDVCLNLMYGELLFPPDAEHPEGRSWNQICQPEWEYDDLKTKVRNAYNHGENPVGAKADALAAFGTLDVPGARPVLVDDAPAATGGSFDQYLTTSDPSNAVAQLLHWADEFISKEGDYDFIVDEWLPAVGLTALLGKRGIGKSVHLIDLVMHIVFDMKWNNIEVDPDWAVVYICGEDPIGVRRNIQAWCAHHHLTPSQIPEGRLLVAEDTPTLTDASAVRTWAEEIKKRMNGRRVIVVLDTWQRATSRSSQSDDKEMALAVHHAEALARSLNGCTIASFHPPKAREDTIHGSNIIENATVAIWQMTEDSGEKSVEVIRIKGCRDGSAYKFRMQQETTGDFDKHGRETTGVCSVRTGGGANGKTMQEEEIEETLRIAIARVLEPALTAKKASSGITFKEACELIIAYISRSARDDVVSQAYYHTRGDMLGIQRGLKNLFPPGQSAYLDEVACIQIDSNKFVLRGSSQNSA